MAIWKTIAQKRVHNMSELISFLQESTFALHPLVKMDDVSIETEVILSERILTDGSKVYDLYFDGE